MKETFADDKGNWELEIPLEAGTNEIRLVARDPGNNTAEKTLTITWNPTLGESITGFLSKTENQYIVAGISAILLFLLFLIHHGEKVKRKKEEEVSKQLTQAFEELRVAVMKYNGNLVAAISDQEVQAKIRAVLMRDPFYAYIKSRVNDYLAVRQNKQKALDWLNKDFNAKLKKMLIEYDPLRRLMPSDYYILLSAYEKAAHSILKELATKGMD